MIHVCFALNDDTGHAAKFVGTAMLSIFENITKPLPSVTVHILHDNTLTDDNRNKFSYLAGRYGQLVNFYNVEELCADKLAEFNQLFPNLDKAPFNKATLYKFLISQVLSTDIKKVIYFESDTIVNTDISELWRVDLEDKILGVVPTIAIGFDIHTQDKIVADGFVKQEDYFHSGVLLIDVQLLRGEAKKVSAGMQFVKEQNYLNLLDQTVLNYCFSLQTIKLSARFNQSVRWVRRRKESIARKIYQYTDNTLRLDTSEPFNMLWMEYFAKTPWFDAAAMGRLYENFQQIHISLKKSMANISLIMSGKTRAFAVMPGYVDELKKVFRVRENEEIILLENRNSLQKLVDSMKAAQGKKVFFIMAQNFPFNMLVKAGFVFGRDFLNAIEFLSEEQGVPLNSYKLLKNI